MKKLCIGIFLVLLATAGFVFSKADNRWMALHYYQAHSHAQKLLAGKRVPPPLWAKDMIISNNDDQQLVMFADKKTQRVYAFSPDLWPSQTHLQWRKIWQHWYVSL